MRPALVDLIEAIRRPPVDSRRSGAMGGEGQRDQRREKEAVSRDADRVAAHCRRPRSRTSSQPRISQSR